MRLGRDILQALGFILIVAGIALATNAETYLSVVRQYLPLATSEWLFLIAVVSLALGAYLVVRKRPVEL